MTKEEVDELFNLGDEVVEWELEPGENFVPMPKDCWVKRSDGVDAPNDLRLYHENCEITLDTWKYF